MADSAPQGARGEEGEGKEEEEDEDEEDEEAMLAWDATALTRLDVDGLDDEGATTSTRLIEP